MVFTCSSRSTHDPLIYLVSTVTVESTQITELILTSRQENESHGNIEQRPSALIEYIVRPRFSRFVSDSALLFCTGWSVKSTQTTFILYHQRWHVPPHRSQFWDWSSMVRFKTSLWPIFLDFVHRFYSTWSKFWDQSMFWDHRTGPDRTVCHLCILLDTVLTTVPSYQGLQQLGSLG